MNEMNEMTFDCYGECVYKGFRIVHTRELPNSDPWTIMRAKIGMRADYYNDSYYVIKGNWISERVSDVKILVDAIDKIEREMKGKTKIQMNNQ